MFKTGQEILGCIDRMFHRCILMTILDDMSISELKRCTNLSMCARVCVYVCMCVLYACISGGERVMVCIHM